MQKTLVTVLSFNDAVQARLAKERLASVGIPAHLDGDTAAAASQEPGSAPAAIKLEVSEEDLERARELLSRPAEVLSDEDEEEQEIDPDSAEALATRAWRAAFYGMAILPFLMQLYSFWLVLKLLSRNEDVSPAGMRKVYGALAIDGVVLLMLALLLRGALWM